MRFMYFCKQDKQKRDEIAEKELLKIYARLYKREKSEGIIKQDYIKAYNEMVDMSGLNVPNIDDVNEDKEFNSFPNMYDLCHLSGRKGPKNDYFLYKCLCEDVHGKLIAIVIRSQSEKYQNFTRATMLLLNFCNEMVILVDKTFLDSQQRKSVEPCIKKVNETIMGPASFLERIFFKKIIGKDDKNET